MVIKVEESGEIKDKLVEGRMSSKGNEYQCGLECSQKKKSAMNECVNGHESGNKGLVNPGMYCILPASSSSSSSIQYVYRDDSIHLISGQ